MEKTCVLIGMDLGTFKTSVASSTGVREAIHTAVGWPKDPIAQKLFGRDVVFGKDILEHRLALEVVRPFEKGVLKYRDPEDLGMPDGSVSKHQEAARLLVEYAVSLTRLPKGVPIHGVIGAPARASVVNKQMLLDASKGAFDAVLIVSEPFAVAYGMNCLSDTLVIDIGAGTVDICPMFGTFPAEEDQVTLPIGGDLIDEAFHHRLEEQYPEAQVSLNMAREIKERYGFVHDVDEKAVVTLPVKGRPTPFDVSKPLKEACRTIVSPIITGLETLIARFDPEFQQRLLRNIVLCGGGSQLKGLDRLLEEALQGYGGGRINRVPDAMYAGAFGALKLGMDMPPSYWAKIRNVDAGRKAA